MFHAIRGVNVENKIESKWKRRAGKAKALHNEARGHGPRNAAGKTQGENTTEHMWCRSTRAGSDAGALKIIQVG